MTKNCLREAETQRSTHPHPDTRTSRQQQLNVT